MSFILDALKKSENERQQQAPAEFATLPSTSDSPRAPRWLWVLAALLAINVIVLLVLALRSEPAVTTTRVVQATETAPTPESIVAAAEPPAFTQQLEEARVKLAERPEVSSDTADAATATITSREETELTSTAAQETRRALLPSLTELQLDGTLTLPDLHVDIHVYSDNPSDRFVFINMNKYHESDRLSEGPVVREIARDGVVLEHRGTTFVLPRE